MLLLFSRAGLKVSRAVMNEGGKVQEKDKKGVGWLLQMVQYIHHRQPDGRSRERKTRPVFQGLHHDDFLTVKNKSKSRKIDAHPKQATLVRLEKSVCLATYVYVREVQ